MGSGEFSAAFLPLTSHPAVSPTEVGEAGVTGFPSDSCQRKQKAAEMRKQRQDFRL